MLSPEVEAERIRCCAWILRASAWSSEPNLFRELLLKVESGEAISKEAILGKSEQE